MRLVTFALPGSLSEQRPGLLLGESVIDLAEARNWAQGARNVPYETIPPTLFELIYAGQPAWNYASRLVSALEGEDVLKIEGPHGRRVGYRFDEIYLCPPLPRPMSLRDFYAFEQHVAAANQIRGRQVPEEWYEFPAYYYTNPNSVFGHQETVPYPSCSQALDYELEVACVIGTPGINIPIHRAEDHIFGYMIFNDWSARDIQRKEMKIGLGPAKGKDFASSLGPWIVTPDELVDRYAGKPGVYNLRMTARVNGVERSSGNWKDIHYSFGEMIARASQDTYLLPGDVLGSGTVGTGCLLELTRAQGPWLQPGDVVELEIERLGVLTNQVREMNSTGD